ncbi:MAG: ribonuclease P protein component [Candidatus Tyrphobacter sp.]
MRSYATLRRRSEFAVVRRRGKILSRPTLALYLAPFRGERRWRAGITVTTAVGKAVVRNAVRRRIGSALHELLLRAQPRTLLVVAKPAAATADFQRLRSDLRSALEALSSPR